MGADIDEIPILWVAAPLTGLLIQPVIGYMSDNTWGKWGRRRPYFLIGAILSSLALIVMPHSPYLWFAAIMLWVLDASINVSMEPFRAFVGDMLPNKQRTQGFATQSFFIGIGAVASSILPIVFEKLGVANTAPEGELPATVTYSFLLGAVVFMAAVGWTVYRTKEYSPEELAAFEAAEKEELPETENQGSLTRSKVNYLTGGIIFLIIGIAAWAFVASQGLKKELFILGGGLAAFGIARLIAHFLRNSNSTSNGFYQIMDDLFHMPKTMGQLAVVQFFSWFALFAMWIYTTSAITEYHYGTTDTDSELYNQGANYVGWMFGIYNGVAALVAFGLSHISQSDQ